MVKVSVVILNYNGSKFLENLLDSLSKQTFRDFEVVFVDNASTDGSLQLLDEIVIKEPTKRLHIKVVMNNVNLGYCRGNNVGLKHANGEYVIFLNNDAYVSETWLKELVEVMDTHPSVGACQSRLIKPQTGEVQSDGWLLDIYGRAQELMHHQEDSVPSNAPFYVSGASMITRRSALSITGCFDPEIFYGDFDLCWRLRLLGYDMAVAPRSICYHYGGVATKLLVPPVKSAYNHNKETLRVLMKNYSMRNIIKRIPLSVIIQLVEAIDLCFKCKTPLYLASFIQALMWNLKKLRNTLIARCQVQSSRKVSDGEIEKRMTHYSVYLQEGGGLK